MVNVEAKVGIFAIAGLLLLGLGIFSLGDFSVRREYPLSVEFRDVAGLPDKSVVRLSGVDIGKVKSIEMEGDHVLVHLAVREGVKICRDARFQIGSTSIIGSKYLQIDQGHDSAGFLSPGARVKGDNILPLDRMLASTLSTMQRLMDEVSQKGRLGRDLSKTMENLRDLTANMNELISTVQPRVESSMKNMEDISAKLDGLIAKVDSLVNKINTGQGVAGALVTDEKMRDDLKTTMANVKDASGRAKDILTKVTDFKVHWKYTSRYEPQAAASRSDFGVEISPRLGRYYYLGIANLRNGDDQSPRPDYAEKNKVEAQLGWTGQDYDFYAGLIRGAGGFGIRYTPFGQTPALKRLSVNAAAYDFLRNRTINGREFNAPQYDLGTELHLSRVISLGAGVVDIKGTGNTSYSLNLKFEDKDIAYLLGLVTLGTVRTSGGN
ncbi:MAG: MlaD family protein [Elusimicrobiales bacterium]